MDRLDRYFGEVFNRLAPEDHVGLHAFLERACGLNQSPRWAWEAVAPMA
jgi:hypothetical protein